MIDYQYISDLLRNEMYEECYEEIIKGLKQNYKDYELYFALGEYYLTRNINQAYLCYENALFYCEDEKDKEYICNVINEVKNQGVEVNPYSVIIVSYNSSDAMKICIDSIKNNINIIDNQIIVVDNDSSDGIREWLEKQDNVILIKNNDNKGFGAACNQGIKAASSDYDIFLLNNDTLVTPNAIFWMRMGLYENSKVGAVGCESNCAAGQMIEEKCKSLEEYIKYGISNNIPSKNPYEKRVWLSGFALMFKRRALDDIGVLDLRYGMGYYEDVDICVRLQYAGYQCVLCHNSFIFHWGSKSFGENKKRQQELMQTNRMIFKEKWNFDIQYYSYAREDIISLITDSKDIPIRVLEIGCGCGATLSKIKYLWPDSKVEGIEIVDSIAKIGANNLHIVQGNIENMNMNYPEKYFDYVIMGDVLEHLLEPAKVLMNIKQYLKNTAKLLISIPNIMHISVLIPLLKGEFQYKESGILDETHVKFFTLKSIAELLNSCDYIPEEYAAIINEVESSNIPDIEKNKFFNALEKIPDAADKVQFNAYQYVIKASVESASE